MSDAAYLAEDAEDCRHALAAAVDLASRRGDIGLHHDKEPHWLALADCAYRFLRSRDSLRAIRVSIVPGTPYLEGTSPMTTTFNLDDTDEVVFSLTGRRQGRLRAAGRGLHRRVDARRPDSTGAVLTVSDDTTTATVAAGVPDSNLLLSVVVTNPDASTLSGAEAIIVQATAATTVGLVAGTPTAE